MNKQKLYIKTIPFIFNILLHIMVLSIDRFTLLASFLHLWEETPGKPPLLVRLEKNQAVREKDIILLFCVVLLVLLAIYKCGKRDRGLSKKDHISFQIRNWYPHRIELVTEQQQRRSSGKIDRLTRTG
jgi:hypothetical protein